MCTCPSCGFPLESSERFCRNCGAPAPEVDRSEAEKTPIAPDNGGSEALHSSAKPVSMGAFIGLLLLFLIPVVGVIAAIVFAFFAKKNQTVSNFARAVLVIMGVAAVLMLVGGWFLSLLISFVFRQAVAGLSHQLAAFEPTISTLEELIRLLLGA